MVSLLDLRKGKVGKPLERRITIEAEFLGAINTS
jgi:hypothetical protein